MSSPDEEKGQMDSFLVDLLQYQPQRTEATGFLTDANIIQFFKIEKTGPLSYYLHESNTYNLADEGGPLLLGLLQTNPTKLGLDPFILFNNKEIVCNKVLGVGATSVVYEGILDEKPVVVKRFRKEQLTYLSIKKANLNKVKHIPGVPMLVGTTKDDTALLLSPIGIHFFGADENELDLPFATR
jgi:hypothetical protein